MKKNRRIGSSEYWIKSGVSHKREEIERDLNAALMISSIIH